MSRRNERLLQQLGGVQCGGVALSNPFLTASGTSGHDVELGSYLPISKLGAVVVKSLFHEPWPGNPAPRVHLAQGGMINAVGLQGPGVVSWIDESLPKLESANATVIVSIWGRTIHEYVLATAQLQAAGQRIAAIEVNLSCPNLEGRSGIIAHDSELSGQIIAAVCAEARVPVWAKLSANTDRVVEVATVVRDAGASALTLINTMLGMQVQTASGKKTLGNGGGGLSGPAIRPIAIRAVHDVRSAMPDVDIIGVGGISRGDDAIEMMMAGANVVQIGTASFYSPSAPWDIAREAAERMSKLGHSSWSDVCGLTHRAS